MERKSIKRRNDCSRYPLYLLPSRYLPNKRMLLLSGLSCKEWSFDPKFSPSSRTNSEAISLFMRLLRSARSDVLLHVPANHYFPIPLRARNERDLGISQSSHIIKEIPMTRPPFSRSPKGIQFYCLSKHYLVNSAIIPR